MATYKAIQNWVQTQYGFVPKTCWIAHCKEMAGLSPRTAPNRKDTQRLVPCPQDKQEAIYAAFRALGLTEVL